RGDPQRGGIGRTGGFRGGQLKAGRAQDAGNKTGEHGDRLTAGNCEMPALVPLEFRVLPASCRQKRTIRDRMFCGETPAAPYEKRCGRKRGARPSRSLRSASRRAAGAADSIHRLVRQGEGCQLVGGTPTRAVGTTALPIWGQQLAHCLAALTSVCSLSPRGTSGERAGERGFALSSLPLPGPLLRLRSEESELSSRVNVASRHIP